MELPPPGNLAIGSTLDETGTIRVVNEVLWNACESLEFEI